MELAIEQIKISKALRLSVQYVGHGNRSTFYRWMGLLGIQPDSGLIAKRDLALLCTFGKALAATGSKRASAKAVLEAKRNWTDVELYEFAFSTTTTFQQIGDLKNAS